MDMEHVTFKGNVGCITNFLPTEHYHTDMNIPNRQKLADVTNPAKKSLGRGDDGGGKERAVVSCPLVVRHAAEATTT
eukprot:5036020-Amphidinium_carterae.1